MNDIPTSDVALNVAEDSTFVDLLIIFAKRKILIISMTILGAIIATLICLLLPNTYKANIKILPPQQAQAGAAALLSQLSGVAGAAAGAAGIKNPNDLYLGMLKSRTISDNLIQRFNLKVVYNKELIEVTRKKLESNTSIASSKDGLIEIEVTDENGKRAADIANAYADELLKLTKTLAVTEASQRRLFFERQLELAKNNLARAEGQLKGVLSTGGVLSVDSDSRAVVETVAKLSAQIASKEVELNSMRAFVTPNNQDFKKLQQQIDSARAEVSRLENGKPSVDMASDTSDQHAGLENIKILREVKYQQMLYELLAKQYEIARLDESKDSSIIQILDKAVEPERKSGPKRAVIVFSSAFLAFMLALLIAFISDLLDKASQRTEYKKKMAELKGLMRR